MQFKVKAGRFVFDKQTKKVKVSKQKGLIHVIRNEDQQTHFKWANLQTHAQQLDIIVFPQDAVFEAVVDKPNTFVLRFGMDDDRYFFWLQEKCEVPNVIKEINRLINYEEPANQNAMVDQGKVPKVQQDKPSEPAAKVDQPQPSQLNSQDFISKLAQGIAAATKKHHHKDHTTALTHLSEVFTPQAINMVLKEFKQDQINKMIQFMPQEHKDAKHVPSSLRSPQLQQAMEVLSDALNSQNALPLFMELGLNQEFLHKHYGVQAFLLALVDKYKKKQ